MNTLWIVLPILTILMYDLGLTLVPGDFSMVIKKPAAVFAALVCQIVALPLIAFVIASVFNLRAELMIGLVLIACCPGGSSSNLFTRIADVDVALSVMLTALSSVITLFTLPFIMRMVTGFAGEALGITLPVGNLIKQNLLLMLAPVVLGIITRFVSPRFAAAADRVLSKTIFPALLIIVSVFFIQNRDTIAHNIGSVGGCVCLLIIMGCLAGGLLSRALKLSGGLRRTIVIETGMQNAAQAIAVASSPFIFNNNEIAIPGIIYSLMMNLILIGYVCAGRVSYTRQVHEP